MGLGKVQLHTPGVGDPLVVRYMFLPFFVPPFTLWRGGLVLSFRIYVLDISIGIHPPLSAQKYLERINIQRVQPPNHTRISEHQLIALSYIHWSLMYMPLLISWKRMCNLKLWRATQEPKERIIERDEVRLFIARETSCEVWVCGLYIQP